MTDIKVLSLLEEGVKSRETALLSALLADQSPAIITRLETELAYHKRLLEKHLMQGLHIYLTRCFVLRGQSVSCYDWFCRHDRQWSIRLAFSFGACSFVLYLLVIGSSPNSEDNPFFEGPRWWGSSILYVASVICYNLFLNSLPSGHDPMCNWCCPWSKDAPANEIKLVKCDKLCVRTATRAVNIFMCAQVYPASGVMIISSQMACEGKCKALLGELEISRKRVTELESQVHAYGAAALVFESLNALRETNAKLSSEIENISNELRDANKRIATLETALAALQTAAFDRAATDVLNDAIRAFFDMRVLRSWPSKS